MLNFDRDNPCQSSKSASVEILFEMTPLTYFILRENLFQLPENFHADNSHKNSCAQAQSEDRFLDIETTPSDIHPTVFT